MLWRFWEENQNVIGRMEGRMTPTETFAVATQLSGRAG
jgi:hypothetical protein